MPSHYYITLTQPPRKHKPPKKRGAPPGAPRLRIFYLRSALLGHVDGQPILYHAGGLLGRACSGEIRRGLLADHAEGGLVAERRALHRGEEILKARGVLRRHAALGLGVRFQLLEIQAVHGQRGVVLGAVAQVVAEQQELQKCRAAVGVLSPGEDAHRLAEVHDRAVAPVGRGHADKAQLLPHPLFKVAQRGDAADVDGLDIRLPRAELLLRRGVARELRGLRVLRYLPRRLEEGDELRAFKVAFARLPVYGALHIAQRGVADEALARDVVHHLRAGGEGALGLQILLRRPAPGLAEVRFEPGVCIYAEAARDVVGPAAEPAREHDVVRAQLRVALQQPGDVLEIAPAYEAVHRHSVEQQEVRALAGGDVGVEPGERVPGAYLAALGVVHLGELPTRAARVEGIYEVIEAPAQGGDGQLAAAGQLRGVHLREQAQAHRALEQEVTARERRERPVLGKLRAAVGPDGDRSPPARLVEAPEPLLRGAGEVELVRAVEHPRVRPLEREARLAAVGAESAHNHVLVVIDSDADLAGAAAHDLRLRRDGELRRDGAAGYQHGPAGANQPDALGRGAHGGKICLAQPQRAEVELGEHLALRGELHEQALRALPAPAALRQPEAAVPGAGELHGGLLRRIEARAVFEQNVFARAVRAEEHGRRVIVRAQAEDVECRVRAGVHRALLVGAALALPV